MESLGFNDLPDNIKSKLEIRDNHWIWIGGITDYSRDDPKGRVRYAGRMEYPHRVVLSILKGFDLDGPLQANHKRECPFSLCCNPDCLYAGTQYQNIQDSIALKHHHTTTQNKDKEHYCPTCGSAYRISPSTGHRYCQRCKNNRRKIWRNKQK